MDKKRRKTGRHSCWTTPSHGSRRINHGWSGVCLYLTVTSVVWGGVTDRWGRGRRGYSPFSFPSTHMALISTHTHTHSERVFSVGRGGSSSSPPTGSGTSHNCTTAEWPWTHRGTGIKLIFRGGCKVLTSSGSSQIRTARLRQLRWSRKKFTHHQRSMLKCYRKHFLQMSPADWWCHQQPLTFKPSLTFTPDTLWQKTKLVFFLFFKGHILLLQLH